MIPTLPKILMEHYALSFPTKITSFRNIYWDGVLIRPLCVKQYCHAMKRGFLQYARRLQKQKQAFIFSHWEATFSMHIGRN